MIRDDWGLLGMTGMTRDDHGSVGMTRDDNGSVGMTGMTRDD